MEKFTSEQLFSLVENMKLSTTIAKTQTFEANARDLPLNFIERILRYGFQRHFNDSVVSIEDKKTKCETVSMNLGEILAGKWEPNKRKETVPTEINAQRKAVLQSLSKTDKEKLENLSTDEIAKKLDETFASNREILQPIVDEIQRPKMKVSVSL